MSETALVALAMIGLIFGLLGSLFAWGDSAASGSLLSSLGFALTVLAVEALTILLPWWICR